MDVVMLNEKAGGCSVDRLTGAADWKWMGANQAKHERRLARGKRGGGMAAPLEAGEILCQH